MPLCLEIVERFGANIPVATPAGTWAVPRVWILLHGLRAADLPALAANYKWPQVFSCPWCHAVSYNANDIANRYCGRCHRFVEDHAS